MNYDDDEWIRCTKRIDINANPVGDNVILSQRLFAVKMDTRLSRDDVQRRKRINLHTLTAIPR